MKQDWANLWTVLGRHEITSRLFTKAYIHSYINFLPPVKWLGGGGLPSDTKFEKQKHFFKGLPHCFVAFCIYLKFN